MDAESVRRGGVAVMVGAIFGVLGTGLVELVRFL